MMLLHLNALVDRWIRVLRAPDFRLLVYLHRTADSQGRVARTRRDIASVTRILPRNIRAMLKTLEARGAVEVISLKEAETVVRAKGVQDVAPPVAVLRPQP